MLIALNGSRVTLLTGLVALAPPRALEARVVDLRVEAWPPWVELAGVAALTCVGQALATGAPGDWTTLARRPGPWETGADVLT